MQQITVIIDTPIRAGGEYEATVEGLGHYASTDIHTLLAAIGRDIAGGE